MVSIHGHSESDQSDVGRRTKQTKPKTSAELFGQSDDDALGPADVAEPIAVLVLRQLADELGAVGAQAGKDVLSEPFRVTVRCVG